ncbi:hypothetical protein S40293_02706 [Stachybotrys chartarum IBT 40293]|nr:hypothetical protein S40293_02706 [Stachybotrys chartarum IBT 40293]
MDFPGRPPVTLGSLPDELIHLLLHQLPPEDTLTSFTLTSQRFHRLADEPLLWRHHCHRSFHYWDFSHEFPLQNTLPAPEVDWKGLFIIRKRRLTQAAALFSKIVSTRVDRLDNMERIAEMGYDVKEFLIEQYRAPDTAQDFLSRRYYAQRLLDSIHKEIAVRVWYQQRFHSTMFECAAAPKQVERCLAAFDMFVLHDQVGDIDEVSKMLDDMTARFRSLHPQLKELPIRDQALILNGWLRENKLTGLRDPATNYRNIRNCLIGQVLRAENHDSIPIISSAIFCSIAERLGIDAHCCLFPTHVYVFVNLDPQITIAGAPITGSYKPEMTMYLDPYGSDEEMSISTLREMLLDFGFARDFERHLSPCSPAALILRLMRNIHATADSVRQNHRRELTELLRGHPWTNMRALMYATEWASLVLSGTAQHQRVYATLKDLSRNYPEDTWLAKTYLWKCYPSITDDHPILLDESDPGEYKPWAGLFLTPRPHPPLDVSSRHEYGSTDMDFKIGQIFRHRRYHVLGVITGWFVKLFNVPHPEDGTHRNEYRCFYRCLQEGSVDVDIAIGPVNIEVIADPTIVDPNNFPGIGRYFKRFDPETCLFVSNIREEFPED